MDFERIKKDISRLEVSPQKKEVILQKFDGVLEANAENVPDIVQSRVEDLIQDLANIKTETGLDKQISGQKISSIISDIRNAFGINEQVREKQIIKSEEKEYSPRDREYYNNPEYLRHDLEAFAKELGEGKTVGDLSINNTRSIKIACANGERVRGETYLLNAAVALGLAKNSKEASLKRTETLKLLKKIAGYEVKEYPPRDKEYYQNPANVRQDLETFAKQLGEGKTVNDLSARNIMSLSITCANGDKEIKGQTYLYNTAIALELKKQTETLECLKKIAGCEARDKEYYSNPQKVKHDLEAYANKFGRGKTVNDLSARNIMSLSITCANGEKVKGQTYIKNAAVALGFASNTREATSKKAETLKHLKKIAGCESRDKAYYSNPEKIRHDLEAYTKQLGEGKTVNDLSARNIMSLSITCANGDKEIKGQTYLYNTAIALELKKQTETLECLKKIAGYDKESLIDKDFDKIKDLNLEDARSLFHDDNLKFKYYVQFAYPGLSPAEVDAITIRSFKGLYTKEGLDKEQKYLLEHTKEIADPVITSEIPTETNKNSLEISGTAIGVDFVYISGVWNKRIKVSEDGTFQDKIVLKTRYSNQIRVMALNTKAKTRSGITEYFIQQTSDPDDISAFIKLLSDLKGEVGKNLESDPKKLELLMKCIEQMLIKKFAGSFEDGKKYMQEQLAKSSSELMYTVLHTILQKFEAINAKQYPNINPQEQLFFFQKYCDQKIKEKMNTGCPGVVLANAPGLGKTLSALVAVQNKNATIIAPNSVVSSWVEQARKFLRKEDLLKLHNMSGREKKNALRNSNHQHVITNIEFLREINDPERYKLISRDGKIVLVYDEAQSLVNDSNQTQGAMQIENSFWLMLSASPFKNPEACRKILKILYPEKPEYANKKAFGEAFPLSDPQSLKILHAHLQDIMIRFRKKDVMEEFDRSKPLAEQKGKLPIKDYIDPAQRGEFYMSNMQAEAVYEMFLDFEGWCRKYDKYIPKDEVAKLDILVSKDSLSKKHALRQTVNNLSYLGLPEEANGKEEEIKSIIKECISEGRKTVLFCKYNAQALKYAEIFKDLNPAMYTGITSKQKYVLDAKGKKMRFKVDKKGEFILDPVTKKPIQDTKGEPMLPLDYERTKFQNDPTCKLIISTVSAGSVGVTFTAGKAMIHDDQPEHYIEQYQSEDRIHRIDDEYMTHYDVRYYKMVSKYHPEFLEKMKTRWVRESRTAYTIIESEKSGHKARRVPIDLEEVDQYENVEFSSSYEEVLDSQIAESEELPTAYDKFFRQGTFDQVQMDRLESQKYIFEIINDGLADETEITEDRVDFFGFNEAERSEEDSEINDTD